MVLAWNRILTCTGPLRIVTGRRELDIWRIVQRASALFPRSTAVIDGQRSVTYAELFRRAGALGAWWRRRGVEPGDRVAVLARNGLAFVEAYFAAAGIGAVLCPLNTRLSPKELIDIIKDSGARHLLSQPRFAEAVRAVRRGCPALDTVLWAGGDPTDNDGPADNDDPYEEVMASDPGELQPVPPDPSRLAHLYYTSGTTGRPKGVMLTHRNVCTHALATIAELGLGETDVWGHIAPMFHLADAWATFAITWVGGVHCAVPSFDPDTVLDAVQRHRVTVTNLIPTMLNQLLKHPDLDRHDLSSPRLVLSGGAPIAPDLVRRVVDGLGCDYVQTYGMTETSPYLTLSTLKASMRGMPRAQRLAIAARTGRPFATVELQVVDDAGQPVAADDRQVGEIWVRGETVTPGYWNRPDETEAAFVDGWLRTGDLATLDAEGYVNIVDRKKEMIISGGENVFSIEVENVLYRHPAVLEAAVFGLPDPRWGETVAAAVVPRPGREVTRRELEALCRAELAGFKCPTVVHIVDQLPRTGSGKISKRALRHRLSNPN